MSFQKNKKVEDRKNTKPLGYTIDQIKPVGRIPSAKVGGRQSDKNNDLRVKSKQKRFFLIVCQWQEV